MTLDEEIRYCKEVAEEKESICNVIENEGETWTDSGKNYYDICKKCASEHRQLAEWLRELRALKENDDVKDVFKNCDTCKYQSLEVDEFPCDRCHHRYINQYVYDDKREVNADDRN